MAILLSKNDDDDFIVTTSLFLHSLEVIITAVFYNPALTLAILDGHDWTQQFFGLWFKYLPKLTRVHDKKMCIAAICVLFEWMASQNGGQVPLAQSAGLLVSGALQVFKDLPEALLSELWCYLEESASDTDRGRGRADRREQERAFAEAAGEDDDESEEEFDFGEDEDEEGEDPNPFLSVSVWRLLTFDRSTRRGGRCARLEHGLHGGSRSSPGTSV